MISRVNLNGQVILLTKGQNLTVFSCKMTEIWLFMMEKISQYGQQIHKVISILNQIDKNRLNNFHSIHQICSTIAITFAFVIFDSINIFNINLLTKDLK